MARYCKEGDINDPKKCTKCYERQDMLSYDKWNARSQYTKAEYQGINTSENQIPFGFGPMPDSEGICHLNCKEGYF